MIIKKARITKQPKSIFDAMPMVFVTLENGEEKFLFQYYPEEIQFYESDFIGLTVEEARKLKFDKDVKFLQS